MPRKSNSEKTVASNNTVKKQTKRKTVVKKPEETKLKKNRTPKSTKPDVNTSNNEILNLRQDWIKITQEITKLRSKTNELEDERMVITNKLSKLMEDESFTGQTKTENKKETVKKPVKKNKKETVKKNVQHVDNSDDELSENNTSDSESSSSDSESEDDVSEVSLSESSDSLSDSSDEE
jgi:hypothetical protein